MSSPSKLFSCVEAKDILQSPINNSPSKIHWSFSKTSRFPQEKVYCDNIYNIPTTKTKRGTSFGYGKKTDLDIGKHPHNITPPPDSYNIDTFVQINKLHRTGYNIAIGRQLTSPRSYIQLEPIKVPGPGRYEQFKINDTPLWSMRPRTSAEIFPLTVYTTQKIVPGPGAHKEYQMIDPKGRYSVSKYKNSKSKIWDPKSSKRFNKSNNDIPGPGTYNPKNDLSNSGDYVLSTNRSDGKRMILLSNRDSFVDESAKITQTPGPGRYRHPSDFGQYDHINGGCGHKSVFTSSMTSMMKKHDSKVIDNELK